MTARSRFESTLQYSERQRIRFVTGGARGAVPPEEAPVIVAPRATVNGSEPRLSHATRTPKFFIADSHDENTGRSAEGMILS
jgi:hypothetical protein